MRENRLACYADFAVYPVLIAVMVLVITNGSSPAVLALTLAFALGAAFLWTRLENLLHRSLLLGNGGVADVNDRQGVRPRALIGTSTWLSVAAIAVIGQLPATLGVRLIVALIVVAGLTASTMFNQQERSND
jgi:hypothetical protein